MSGEKINIYVGVIDKYIYMSGKKVNIYVGQKDKYICRTKR